MPPSAQRRRQLRRRARALDRGITAYMDAFRWVSANHTRINILVEGDSWFAYPKDWIFVGENSNLITIMFEHLQGKGLVNTLYLAANGDTVVEMMEKSQLRKLRRVLKTSGSKLDLMLFSAGGNDVIGPDDLAPLIRQYQQGFSAADCIHTTRFDRKVTRIIEQYEKLLKLRDQYAPNMHIITHTYDLLKPSLRGVSLFGGIEIGGPWIKPTLDERNIPDHLQADVVRILLQRFRDELILLQNQTPQGFTVVDTQGTLRVGHRTDWRNEIHPTPSGFKRIARKIFTVMQSQFPALPNLP